jgi:hypothetical protein
MSKVNKAFSLDPEVFILLDRYCRSHEEIGGKRRSRSAVVNNAIRWYLGDTADLVNQRDALQKALRERNKQLDQLKNSLVNDQDNSLVITRSWWRRLLGLN